MSLPGRNERPSTSPWSLKVASVAGIPIRLHFTFLLFLAWIVFLGRQQGSVLSMILVPSIFVCVLLHELGHALVARRYGVTTKDITLYPIGGLALLNERPKARDELWIALAGPAVNVAIALITGVALLIMNGTIPMPTLVLTGRSYLSALFAANVVLAVFNMIPAFPMDGGRVLRSMLALHMSEARATRLAAGVGQLLAIVLGFIGLATGQIVLMLIAFFVFVGAGQEATQSQGVELVTGHTVQDAMITMLATLESGSTLDQAATMLLETHQHDFPIVLGDEILGVLARADLVRALAAEGTSGYVAGAMNREYRVLEPSDPLEKAFSMLTEDRAPILVMEDRRLLGMVTLENLSEFLMIEQARSYRAARA